MHIPIALQLSEQAAMIAYLFIHTEVEGEQITSLLVCAYRLKTRQRDLLYNPAQVPGIDGSKGQVKPA
jgi:hypothetical protein